METKEKILLSACLAGKQVRYDGKIKEMMPQIKKLYEKYDVITVCPEILGGLPMPRPQSEITDGRVINILGNDVTEYFLKGAKKVLETARKNDIKLAVLKQSSPSCGSKSIYNGKFEKKKIDGMGITAKYLKENGITVIGEDDLPK